MNPEAVIALTALIFIAAALYSTVGHAGASGYLAAMAIFGLAPAVMKPTALVLNILVASIATAKFAKAGFFSWRTLWPFALTSIPMAVLGGSLKLEDATYKRIAGAVLIYSAVRLLLKPRLVTETEAKPPRLGIALLSGAGMGFLSGLVGVGGGIFLSPLLLLMKWEETRRAAGVAAAFILVNSIAGLLGHLASVREIPTAIPWWLLAAGVGGWIGAELGSRKLDQLAIRRVLSVVLLVAGVKMLLV
ncbi:MAG: sulfite exporter TauE/SafE family protein [Pedosphaera sp.]|nr:sulfite exporter TauE/SafE family protein [Pedosphaera sp.]MST00886.1 sulfite exporter TauE/SafE family protein [Pedosphaera sp.]